MKETTQVKVTELQYNLWLYALGTYWVDYRNRMPAGFNGEPIDLRDVYRTIAHLSPRVTTEGR